VNEVVEALWPLEIERLDIQYFAKLDERDIGVRKNGPSWHEPSIASKQRVTFTRPTFQIRPLSSPCAAKVRVGGFITGSQVGILPVTL
jgi:hypothetical protein